MRTAPSIVRLASPDDDAELVELLHAMHAETGSLGRFDPEMVLYAVRAGIDRRGGLCGVIRSNDNRRIEATVGLFMGGSWYSRDYHLFDLWTFVPERYRKSSHAKALIEFAKNAAVELRLPLMMTTVVTDHQTARRERLFERELPRSGSVFLFKPMVAVPVPVDLVAA